MYLLSDPWDNFIDDGSRKLLQEIINKQGVNLDAIDFMIIFNPFLPAGTVKENANYLSLGFDLLDKYVGQFEINDKSGGIHDFWQRLCMWSYIYKNELVYECEHASLVKSIYSMEFIQDNWDSLYQRWFELGEVSTPSYHTTIEKRLLNYEHYPLASSWNL